MAIRRPASQLNSEDLPTFGRPTITTLGRGMDRASSAGPGLARIDSGTGWRGRPALRGEGRPRGSDLRRSVCYYRDGGEDATRHTPIGEPSDWTSQPTGETDSRS